MAAKSSTLDRARRAATAAGSSARAATATTPKAGARIGGRLVDARPDRTDLRDLPYRPPLKSLKPVHPSDTDIAKHLPGYVAAGLVRDQGTEGACTGFGLACVVNYLLYVGQGAPQGFQGASPRMLYELAKRYDEWPGSDYDGSSCRGALKGWHKHGVCSEDKWPYVLEGGRPVDARAREGWDSDAVKRPLGVYYRIDKASVVDMQAAIADIGAVYVSADVHDGWNALTATADPRAPRRHSDLPVIAPMKDPGSRGGHAFALVGYNERGFIVQNSWGTQWGRGGFGILPYADWVANASDAWACALGVPVAVARPKPATARARGTKQEAPPCWRVGSGRSLATLERARRSPNNPADDPWPFDHEFLHKAYEPVSSDSAYERTLVMGSDGELVATDFTRPRGDALRLAEDIVVRRPMEWFGASGPARLAIYAHGGLNSEDESIQRIRVLAPYFEANGVRPLFLTWKTGVGEILRDMVEDGSRRELGDEAMRAAGLLSEARDRAVEPIARLLGRGIWEQMKENARLAVRAGSGLHLLARCLVELKRQLGHRKLEVHLIGHSAGAILLGHLLRSMLDSQLGGDPPRIATCSLLAPACTMAFAVESYKGAALLLDMRDVHVYALSDDNERDDGLPSPGAAAYGKSLLYLVSRALEEHRKTPLLGMDRALDRNYASAAWWDAGQVQSMLDWQKSAAKKVLVKERHVRNTREGGQVQATHDSFDNNIPVLTEVLERVAGRTLVKPMEWLDY